VDRGQGSKAIGEKKEANQRLRTTEIDLFYAKKKKREKDIDRLQKVRNDYTESDVRCLYYK